MAEMVGNALVPETITRHVNDMPDSLEIGTPAKGGCIKVYGNYLEPEEFRQKILNAVRMRVFAQEAIEKGVDSDDQ